MEIIIKVVVIVLVTVLLVIEVLHKAG